MDFSKWWTKLNSAELKEDLTTRLTTQLSSLSVPKSCYPPSQSCSVHCGLGRLELSLFDRPETEKNPEVYERRSVRVVQPGLREDEEDFVEYKGSPREEALSDISAAAGEDELRTPPDIGPPMLESPGAVEQRTITASSDIESVRTSEDMELTVQDNCSAMHMIQSTSRFDRQTVSKCDESSQTTFRHGTKQADSWVRQSVLSPSNPTYCCLAEPVLTTPRDIHTFANLLKLLAAVESEKHVSLRSLNNIVHTNLINKDVAQGDIIYIEKGTAGVGRNHKNVSTVVVSAHNSARKSTHCTAKSFIDESVAADCRLWELVYPMNEQATSNWKTKASGTCWATPDKAGDKLGQLRPRRCWGVWELPLDTLRVSNPKKKNCLAFFLNCYLVVVALRTILKGEKVCLFDPDAVTDLKDLVSSSTKVVEETPPEHKPKLSHFPIPIDSGAVCATLTTSASEDAPSTPKLTERPSKADELQQIAKTVTELENADLAAGFKRWPSMWMISNIHKIYNAFKSVTDIGSSEQAAPVNDLLFRLAALIVICRPYVEEILAAESAQAFLARHQNMTGASGYINPVYRMAKSIHAMVDVLAKNSAKLEAATCKATEGQVDEMTANE